MTVASAAAPLTIAGHGVASLDRAGGMLSLRVALHGGSLEELARALGKLDGVRVTTGPEGGGRARCYVAQCPGFKMVLSSPPGEAEDFALALVSRTPQAALSVMSDLGATFERMMTVPPRLADLVSMTASSSGASSTSSSTSSLRRSSLSPGKSFAQGKALAQGKPLARGKPLAQGKPLARKTALTRRTPLGRGRFGSH